jgi:hypothetical protein
MKLSSHKSNHHYFECLISFVTKLISFPDFASFEFLYLYQYISVVVVAVVDCVVVAVVDVDVVVVVIMFDSN